MGLSELWDSFYLRPSFSHSLRVMRFPPSAGSLHFQQPLTETRHVTQPSVLGILFVPGFFITGLVFMPGFFITSEFVFFNFVPGFFIIVSASSASSYGSSLSSSFPSSSSPSSSFCFFRCLSLSLPHFFDSSALSSLRVCRASMAA